MSHRALSACWCLRRHSAKSTGFIQMCPYVVVARLPVMLHM